MKADKEILLEKHLYVFNLSTDSDNPILAFTQDWVNAFQKIIRDVSVVSTWVGKHSFPQNVQVIELGGGNFTARGKSLVRLTGIALHIIRNRKRAIVFHHMSTKTAAILGPLFRLFQIKQGLWYSHSNKSFELIYSSKFMNKIFSSTPDSLPIKSKKARYVGHGINVRRFPESVSGSRKEAILSLGRIAKIKNNELLIDAVSRSRREFREVHLVGPIGKSETYLEHLLAYGENKEVAVKYLGEVPHSEVAELLCKYSICYTGNPDTVDKSVIEGALSGCFTLASQKFILEQTGMASILDELGIAFTSDLAVQIENLRNLNSRNDLRVILRNRALEKNSVSNATRQIIEEIMKP